MTSARRAAWLVLALGGCQFGSAFDEYCKETGRCPDGGAGGGATAGGASAGGGTAGGATAGGATAGGATAGGATAGGATAGGATAGGATAGGATAGGAVPSTGWLAIAAGAEHTCGVLQPGTLWCWGANASGQLGGGAIEGSDRKQQIAGASDWASVAAGSQSTCALKTDQSLWCWGNATGTALAAPVNQPGSWSRVSVGGHVCAISTSSELYCMGGDNTYGQLGLGNTTPAGALTRVNVDAGMLWTSVATGADHTCAVSTTNELWCWGNAANVKYGLIGNRISPEQVISGRVRSVATSETDTCVLFDDGGINCYGINLQPQGTTVNNGGPLVDLYGGQGASICGRRPSGQLVCFGTNGHGQHGNGPTNTAVSVLAPVGLPAASAAAVGDNHVCAISDGGLRCWGRNNEGQVGIGTRGRHLTPTQVAGSWMQVATARQRTCAVRSDGGLACWGRRGVQPSISELASNVAGHVQLPLLADPGIAYTSMCAGESHGCGVTAAGDVRCWGDGTQQQLGQNGNPTSQNLPVAVTALSNIAKVSCGAFHSCAMSGDAGAWCWGANNAGQLGSGNVNPAWGIPERPDGGRLMQAIAAGASHTCAVSGGAVSCWGANSNGQLGIGMTTNPLGQPAPLPGATTGFSSVSAGIDQTCGLKGGELHCWGGNAAAQLGLNNTNTPQPSPQQVGGTTWQAVSCGNAFSCGVDSTGLWCWGSNGSGRSGTGSATNTILTPAQVMPGVWRQVSAGEDHACAVLTDESLWCWGDNLMGQLGDGTAFVTTPTVVP